jgi:hypothetical protein
MRRGIVLPFLIVGEIAKGGVFCRDVVAGRDVSMEVPFAQLRLAQARLEAVP